MPRAIEIAPEILPDGKVRVQFVFGDRGSMPTVSKTGTVFASKAALIDWVRSVQDNMPPEVLLAQALSRWIAADPTLLDAATARGTFIIDDAKTTTVTRR